MLERVRVFPAAHMAAQDYIDDFYENVELAQKELWKLERIQDFRQPEDPSYVAMAAGDWNRSLALIEEKRETAAQKLGSADSNINRRVRVVEAPVTAYLQWEMHCLKLWQDLEAQGVRVLDAAQVPSHLEAEAPVPEVVILGGEILYEVLYDPAGLHSGGRRIDDPDVVAACRQEIVELYERSEPIATYFEREIAELPPPGPQPG